MPEAVTLSIGGLAVRVTADDARLAHALRVRWRPYLSARPPAWQVTVTWTAAETPAGTDFPRLRWHTPALACLERADVRARFDLPAARATVALRTRDPWPRLEYALRVVYALLAFQRGGVLFHGAGLQVAERGVVLFGPSGIGKSTAARNAPTAVLNDDLVLLLPGNGGWQVGATPFTNPSQVSPTTAGRLPLAALCRLVQSPEVALEPLSGAAALAHLLACVPVLPAEPHLAADLLPRLRALLRAVPVYTLRLRADGEYWEVLCRVV